MFYSIEGVEFSDICSILRIRAASRDPTDRPTVYLDVSWLARKLSTPNYDGVSSIIHLANQFVSAGIRSVLCFDNREYRHHSKKATVLK